MASQRTTADNDKLLPLFSFRAGESTRRQPARGNQIRRPPASRHVTDLESWLLAPHCGPSCRSPSRSLESSTRGLEVSRIGRCMAEGDDLGQAVAYVAGQGL